MRTITSALLLSVVYTSLACAQRSDFEFTLSGPLASKLDPGTRVLIWNPVIETKPKWVDFSIEDLPVTVPFEQLGARHIWIVSFVSRAQRRTVFSIGLAPELFDKPRRIDLKLDRPSPRIRPSCLGRLDFQYYSGITQRMWYRELPFWDKECQRIVAAKPPLLSIVRVSDGVNLQESEMEEGCMGSKWWAMIDRSLDLGEKTDLQFVVRYNSGGLWDPIVTKLDFTYHETLHGPFR